MTFRRLRLAALSALLCAGAAAADTVPDYGLPPAAASAAQSIDSERIRAHVRFLAHDLLEGRGTGTRGGEIAAQYIATQFALLGLKPAGDDGSYLQKVRFIGSRTEVGTTMSFAPNGGEALPLKLYEDYVTTNQTPSERAELDAPIVFVGYGIDAPEYQWDDYKNVDVKGKIALVIVNEPPSKDAKFFNGDALTYYGRWIYKYEEAARKGAVGVLLIHRDDLASYPWQVVRSSWTNEQVSLADDTRPKLKEAGWIQLDVARLLFNFAGKNLEQMINLAGTRDFKPFELPVRLRAHIESKVRRFESTNVIATLPGADKNAKQAVLYSAHYDHLGIAPETPGAPDTDRIYNGAVDNATGCGVLLELAHAYATMKDKPAHPVLFASVTAEEKGLLGSKYLGEHPPLPAADIALNLNYDSIAPLGVPEGVEVVGSERLNFYPEVEKTAKSFKLAIEPDSTPTAGHYYRSDHFSMARVGVPAFSIGSGSKYAGHSREWGLDQAKDYVANRYHRPSDEYRPEMDFTANAELARFGFVLGWRALTAKEPIAWQAGDEFEAARQKSEK